MLSEKLYRALLIAYPREHRREYGELMVQLFRDRMRRDGGGLKILRVWLAMIIDLVTSALKEHSNGEGMAARASNGSTGLILVCATMLFFGFNILHEFIAWPLFQTFRLIRGQGPMVLFEIPELYYWIPFVILVVSYLFVRRLGHQVLSQLWLYAIVASALGLAYHPSVSETFQSAHAHGLDLAVIEAARLIVVVLFARRLSAISFRHSLLFIGLTTAMQAPASFLPPHLHTDPAVAWPLSIYIAFLVGGLLLRGLAVWALVNTHAVTSSMKVLLPPVVVMVLLDAAFNAVASNVWAPMPIYYDWVLPTLMVPALSVVAAYAVRVRGPGEPQPGLKLQST